MKKIFSGLLAIVLALAMIVPGASPALAESEPGSEEVQLANQALAIRAPRVAEVNQPVTIHVVKRRAHEPVEGAEVYAIEVEKANAISIRGDNAGYSAIVEKYVALAKEQDAFIGETDERGIVTHEFSDTGRYILIAVKDGYSPGFSRIGITLSMVRALAVRAPGVAEIDKQVTIKVIERHVYKPVADAEVYAVKMSGPEEVTEAVSLNAVVIKADPTDNAEAEEYLTLAKERGIFIGTTDERGVVTHSFGEAGRYVLVAIKDGFKPGFSRIGIKPSLVRALAIRAPKTSDVGQPVTIKVTERYTQKPTAEASVYAVKMEKISEIVIENDNTVDVARTEEYAALVKERGAYIGETGDDGIVTHKFDEAGRYVLIAVKDGYVPGFARISITLLQDKALAIRAPQTARINQPVTIKVVERRAHNPIADAGVYAVKLGDTDEIDVKSDNIIGAAAEAEEYVLLAKERGDFIGRTNDRGVVTHRFGEAGRYILVAVKDDHKPGFSKISIGAGSPLELNKYDAE